MKKLEKGTMRISPSGMHDQMMFFIISGVGVDVLYIDTFATVYKGNIIKNLIVLQTLMTSTIAGATTQQFSCFNQQLLDRCFNANGIACTA